MHKRTYKYRLKPTKAQERAMQHTLDACRWLYNHLLEQRKSTWEERRESLGLYDQHASLPVLKRELPSLAGVHSQVLQNVAVRIDLAFKAFFRRVKAGEKPGYPRFRGRGWYDSFCFPQYGNGCELKPDGLYLSKIGKVKVKQHHTLEGTPKTVCVQRSSTGTWYACVCCEVEAEPLPASEEKAGIDVGLASFATLSTGEVIPNPRFFRRDEKDLARVQRKLSKAEKGTPERRKRRKAVAHVHERIRNRRSDFSHQQSRRFVKGFGFLAVEDIAVKRLVHNHCLAKSLADAAWSDFIAKLAYKAESAGRVFVRVNPAYTSQDCSRCGHRQKMPLSERMYRCSCCGLEIDRDHNAALNILALGLQCGSA